MSNGFLPLRLLRLSLSISVTDDSIPPRLRDATMSYSRRCRRRRRRRDNASSTTWRSGDGGRKSDGGELLDSRERGKWCSHEGSLARASTHLCVRVPVLRQNAPSSCRTAPTTLDSAARHCTLYLAVFPLKRRQKCQRCSRSPPTGAPKYSRRCRGRSVHHGVLAARAATRLATTARLSILQRRVAEGSQHQHRQQPRQQQRQCRKSGGRGAAARTRVLL